MTIETNEKKQRTLDSARQYCSQMVGDLEKEIINVDSGRLIDNYSTGCFDAAVGGESER